ncbi:MAG: DUF2304 domain-containing protein [Wenzhouxiangella sp.]
MSLQMFSALLAGLVVVAIFWLLRRDRLPVMHSLWWLCVAGLIGLLGLFPRLIDVAAGFVGVAYSPSLLFIVAILVLLIKVLLEDVDVSRDRRRLLRLAQKVAMLEERLERLQPTEQPSPADKD